MKNKYKLSILVPMHNEGKEVVRPLLDSIAIQQNVDFDEIEVVITNDGFIQDDDPCKLSAEWLETYPYDIHYFEMEHGGVSACRNYCLDHCSGKYVMFCDDDDIFYNACGLYIVFREIDGTGFDSLVSAFIEETRNPQTKEPVYVNHDVDVTFVHGKIHKRKFLIDNDIRWNPDLTIHEDSYFNCLCQKLAKELKYCQTPFYLWRWRDDSVCRHDPLYIQKTFTCMLDSNTALINELAKRGKKEFAEEFAVQMIFDTYLTMNKKEWIDQDNQEYRKTTEKRFKQYWDEFKHYFESISEDKKNAIIAGQKNRFMTEGMFLESITFNDWIKHIEKSY